MTISSPARSGAGGQLAPIPPRESGRPHARFLDLPFGQAILGFMLVAAWLVVFLAGLTIDSNPLRQQIVGDDLGATVASLFLVLVSYTATNSAILAVLSGMAGALAQSVIVAGPASDTLADSETVDAAIESLDPEAAASPHNGKRANVEARNPQPSPPHLKIRPDSLTAGAIKSFAVFLVYMSGVTVGASDAFGATTPDQYARVVGTTSLLAFIVGFDPKVFLKVLGRGRI